MKLRGLVEAAILHKFDVQQFVFVPRYKIPVVWVVQFELHDLETVDAVNIVDVVIVVYKYWCSL